MVRGNVLVGCCGGWALAASAPRSGLLSGVATVAVPTAPRMCAIRQSRSSSRAIAASKPRPSVHISGPARRAARRAQDRRRPKGALSPPACSRTCRISQAGGRIDRDRGREPGHQPRRLRRQQARSRTSSSPPKSSPSRAGRCRGRSCRPTSSASSKSIAAAAATTSASMPKIIELPNNRVDLVFEITEGEKTGVKDDQFRRQPALIRSAA